MREFEERELPNAPPTCPFRILTADEASTCPNAVPIFDIQIAAGDFSKEQWLENCQYAVLPDHFTARPGFFVARVVGESMNRRIPSGSWCLFRESPPGSRQGKVVLVQARDIHDLDSGGQYTVKVYRSEKAAVGEDSWVHTRIHLEPDSHDPSFRPIILETDAATEFAVIGEFVASIG